MENLTLRTFRGTDGAPLKRIPFLTCSWKKSINEQGSCTLTIKDSVDAETLCAPWRTIVALFRGERILHAGYVHHFKRANDASHVWTIDAGDGMTILDRRLVLNHALASSWTDGQVTVDEDNPSGDWPLRLTGSYADIIGGLVYETIKWGALPFSTLPAEGGDHERNYNSYDLATVYERIHDISQLEDGPEVRFDPCMVDGSLLFFQRTADEIVDHHWRWNVTVPGSLVQMGAEDIEGADMCTQSFATGGREDDRLLVARASSDALTQAGYPVLQTANTQHSSVSELPTLQSYVSADVAEGQMTPKTYGLTADISLDVRVGDWADVRTAHGMLYLKITDVSGDSSKSELTLQARERV